MGTSDDVISSIFGGGDDTPDLPSQRAENEKRTAGALPQGTEESRKRRRQQASIFTRTSEAQLSQPFLLGVTPRQ